MPFFNPSRSTRTLSRKGPITDGTARIRRLFLTFFVFLVGMHLTRSLQATANMPKLVKVFAVLVLWCIMIYYNSIYSDGLDFLTMMLEYVQPCSRSCHSCRSDLKARDSRRHLIVKSIRVSQLIAGWSHESSWCGIPTQKWNQQKQPAGIAICWSMPQNVWNDDV